MNKIRAKNFPEISNEKCWFAKRKGTMNPIFILKMLIERAIDVNKKLHICFVNYEKEFDHVEHEELMKMLEQLNIDGREVYLIKITILEPRSCCEGR